MSSPGDDSRSKRYDRQIRIWGAEGQSRLEAARVLLLNCGPTGSETLKNLVLGGIASFTAVDAARVSARDLGNNFFVAPESLGEPRAKVRPAAGPSLAGRGPRFARTRPWTRTRAWSGVEMGRWRQGGGVRGPGRSWRPLPAAGPSDPPYWGAAQPSLPAPEQTRNPQRW
jgi:hypothetical protein